MEGIKSSVININNHNDINNNNDYYKNSLPKQESPGEYFNKNDNNLNPIINNNKKFDDTLNNICKNMSTNHKDNHIINNKINVKNMEYNIFNKALDNNNIHKFNFVNNNKCDKNNDNMELNIENNENNINNDGNSEIINKNNFNIEINNIKKLKEIYYLDNVTGDDNCLFYSLSKIIFGKPNYYSHIRLLICDHKQTADIFDYLF